MKQTALYAITPVDGRYQRATNALSDYFSEGALIRYRVKTEIEYFIALCQIPIPQLKTFNPEMFQVLRNIYFDFSPAEGLRVKEIESTTNHDVKAVEYFIKEKFDALNLSAYKEFIHFGLTSQDVNNTAMPMMLKDAWVNVIKPSLKQVITHLHDLSLSWKNISMLARTHGQPASPTSLGKEIYVFVDRINKQLTQVDQVPFSAKFGGATGNFNAHFAAYPDVNWFAFSDNLVNDVLELDRSQVTTQIEHYDNLAAFLDALKRINTILIDLARDFWAYISIGYFKQKLKKGEVGSSTMPHKVNPIDFENAEGNLGIANALFEHLSGKLPISRLQRDLTDSTVTRNIGVPLAHTLISFKSILRGLDKLTLNEKQIQVDLENNWAVIAEAIQTILRRENYPNPYEVLKDLTRTNQKIEQKSMDTFIDSLDINDEVKVELKSITPFNYTGKYQF